MSYRPTAIEHLAVQAKLASRVGSSQFLALFADLQILQVKRGIAEIAVGSEASADIIATTQGALMAVVIESVVRKPVKQINVRARNEKRYIPSGYARD